MACPFFSPHRLLDSSGWDPAPRLPLGDAYGGFCHAVPAGSFEPPEPTQRDVCNCGYARGRCASFPPGHSVDAVRFSVVSEDAGRVRMLYILEKDHAPVEHGDYQEDAANALLASQARAFLDSYRSQAATRNVLNAPDAP